MINIVALARAIHSAWQDSAAGSFTRFVDDELPGILVKGVDPLMERIAYLDGLVSSLSVELKTARAELRETRDANRDMVRKLHALKTPDNHERELQRRAWDVYLARITRPLSEDSEEEEAVLRGVFEEAATFMDRCDDRNLNQADARVALWDAVNAYAQACGGDTSAETVNNARMNAVVAVEQAARRVSKR